MNRYECFIADTKKIMEAPEDGFCYVMMYMDIAGFQLVNDFYGVDEGNRMLMALERFLEELPFTSVSKRVFSDYYLHVSKLGQDTDLAGWSLEVVDMLRHFLMKERFHHPSCNPHLAGGICIIKQDVTAAIDHANIARKRAKEVKRTNLCWFDETMETFEQCCYRMEPGCRIAQGFYFSRPLSVRDFEAFLAEKKDSDKDKPWSSEQLAGAQMRFVSQSFLRIMPYPIAGFAPENDKILFATPRFFDLGGFSEEELEWDYRVWGEKLGIQIVGNLDVNEIIYQLDIEEHISTSLQITKKDGSRAFITAYFGKASSPEWGTYILCAFDDKTEQRKVRFQIKECQKALAKEKSGMYMRMAALADLMAVQVTEFDFDTNMIYTYSRECSIGNTTEWEAETTLEDYLHSGMIRSDYVEEYLKLLKKLMTEDEVYLEFPYKLEDGQYHWVSLRGRVALRENGRPVRCIGVTRLIGNRQEQEEIRSHHRRLRKRSGAKERGKKDLLIFLASLSCIVVFICLVFVQYRQKLEEEFYRMATKNMNSYTEAQALEVDSYINGIYSSLHAVAMVLERPGVDPEGAFVKHYLTALNKETDYQTSYRAISEIEEMLEETLFSEVKYSAEKGRFYYSITIPVKKEDGVAGIVWADMAASTLLDTKQSVTQNELLGSYLINGNGEVIYAREHDHEYGGEQSELMHGMEFLKKSQTLLEEGATRMEYPITIMLGKQDGHMTFVSAGQLENNEWYIVNVSRANELIDHTKSIMQNTLVSSLILVTVTIITGIIVFWIFLLQRRRLFFETERYAMLSEFSDTILMQYFYEHDRMVITPNAEKRFKIEALQQDNYLKNDRPMMGIHEDDAILIREALEHPIQGVDDKFIRFRAEKKDGTGYLWCSLQLRFIYENHEAVAAVGKITDINRQKEWEEYLVEQAQKDGLTKIFNKAVSEQEINHLIAQGKMGVLFMMDVDNFKQLNDVYGHAQGDAALMGLSEILQELFRKEDVVGRIGGDEFVAFVSGTQSRELAEERAGRILMQLEEIAVRDGVEMTLSIGIATCPEHGATFRELYDAADQAMYQAKKKGKNQYFFA